MEHKLKRQILISGFWYSFSHKQRTKTLQWGLEKNPWWSIFVLLQKCVWANTKKWKTDKVHFDCKSNVCFFLARLSSGTLLVEWTRPNANRQRPWIKDRPDRTDERSNTRQQRAIITSCAITHTCTCARSRACMHAHIPAPSICRQVWLSPSPALSTTIIN